MTHMQGCPRAANNQKFHLCWWEENMYTNFVLSDLLIW